MRAHFLTKFLPWKRIQEFHFTMYHGRYAAGDAVPLLGGLGQNLSRPVRVIRNGWRIPDVFQPGTTLIVAAKVREALGSLPHLAFRPVEFTKLFDYPYQAGDFSFYDSPAYQRQPIDPSVLFDRLPDVPALHEKAGAYFDMIEPSIKEVIGSYAGVETLKVYVPEDWPPREIPLCADVVREYPILWCGYTILSEQAFALLEPFLDWDYFAQLALDI